MTRRNAIILLVWIAGAAALIGQAQSLTEMDALLGKIAGYQPGQSHEELALFTEFVQNSMGSRERLQQIEARVIKFIESDATPSAKDFVLGQLSYIASNASIPMLTALMSNPETAERARYVLGQIPGPSANEALRSALRSAKGPTQIGIVNSLGQRRDVGAVPILQTLASSTTPETTDAALDALATIGTRAALEALESARSKLSGTAREHASEAYAKCADRLAQGGDKPAAAKVYRQLLAPEESTSVRIRALGGLTATEGNGAIPALTSALHSKDLREQAAAAAFLNRIPGQDAIKAMTTEFPALSAATRVRILGPLAERGDAAAKPLALAALKDDSADVRAEGLSALGQVGNDSSVTVLAEAAAVRTGSERDAARQSLYSLRGPTIDSAILKAVDSTSGSTKAELLTAVGERGISSAGDALTRAVQDADKDVRNASLRALRSVGGAAQVPAMLDVLFKVSTSAERTEVTRTLSAVLRRSQPAPVGALLTAYESAPSLESRLSLLEALGQTSSEQALPLLRASLSDSSPEVRRAAILALTGWKDTAPLGDLLGVAKTSQSPAHKILALRGYIKLLGQPPLRPPAEGARLLGDGLALATEAAEKRAILSLLPLFPCQQSLEMAKGLLKDEAVTNEARGAMDQVNFALKEK